MKARPVRFAWKSLTDILYGERDSLCEGAEVSAFAWRYGAEVEVVRAGSTSTPRSSCPRLMNGSPANCAYEKSKQPPGGCFFIFRRREPP